MGRMSCWLAPAAFILDRATKLWAKRSLQGGPPAELWPGVLRFVYVENTGAAFGLLRGRQALLLIVTGAVLLSLLIWLLFRAKTLRALPRAALWLLLGGALGNFFDRLMYGAVIDFIEIRLFTFPVWNVADACVCVAFLLLAGWILLSREEKGEGPDVG